MQCRHEVAAELQRQRWRRTNRRRKAAVLGGRVRVAVSSSLPRPGPRRGDGWRAVAASLVGARSIHALSVARRLSLIYRPLPARAGPLLHRFVSAHAGRPAVAYCTPRLVAVRCANSVWARGRCRISPPRFLAECCKRQLNPGSIVLLYFRLSTFSDLY